MRDDNKKPNKEIKTWRKILYIIGNILIVLGFILFFSTFIKFSTFSFFEENSGSDFVFGFMRTPFMGFILIFLGSFLKSLAKNGFAGSGLILNPEKEREDLEPFSRSKGGQYADTYDEFKRESNFHEDLKNYSNSKKENIKIRCPHCKTLNDEDAKYCKSCGNKLD